MTKFTFTYGIGDWTLSATTETMQEALLVFDKIGLSRRAISKIKRGRWIRGTMRRKWMTKPNIETPLPDKVYDFIEEQRLDFSLGNIVKYIMRFRKSGDIDNLLKARWFIERELKHVEKTDMDRSNC